MVDFDQASGNRSLKAFRKGNSHVAEPRTLLRGVKRQVEMAEGTFVPDGRGHVHPELRPPLPDANARELGGVCDDAQGEGSTA